VSARTTPVITLAGSPVARGEAYGEAARELIGEAAERWRERIGGGLTVPIHDYLAELVDRTGFHSTASAHCPDLLDELTGLARASGVDERLLFAMNLLDEEWWIRKRFLARAAAADSVHCSGFGVPAENGTPAYMGQNMDLPGWMDGLQILIDLRPTDGPDALIPSWPGMLALDGLNEHGVGVCVNTLAQLPTSRDGLPVAFVIRKVLGQPDRTSAIAMLHELPHASGQNYIVGDPDGVADVECSASGATDYVAPTPRLAHTNHPLARAQNGDGALVDNGSSDRSVPRLAHLTKRLGELDEVTPTRLGAVLAEVPLCRGSEGDPGFTLYSTVMELTHAPALHLSAGPPSTYPLVRFEVAAR
jgi:hypothetical protein